MTRLKKLKRIACWAAVAAWYLVCWPFWRLWRWIRRDQEDDDS